MHVESGADEITLKSHVLSAEFQENFSGKRFKFVVTCHGKYEKVPVEDCREEAHCPPGETIHSSHPLINSLIHSFIDSFAHLVVHSFTHS